MITDNCKESVILICPKFYDYPSVIIDALKRKGFNVIYIDERPSNSTLFKTLLRVGFTGILRKKIHRYYSNRIDSITSDTIKKVLIINPEAIDAAVIMSLKEKYTNAQFTLYMWDSLQNKKLAHHLFNMVDQVFTFDTNDSTKFSIEHLPLFYVERDLSVFLTPERKSSLFFIGNIHSNRLLSINKLEEAFIASGKYFYKILYYPSKILLILSFFKQPSAIRKFRRDIIIKPIPYDRVVAMMAHSECVLDLVHPKQTGLTMRTIEALGLQKKLITNNANITKYDFFNPQLHHIVDVENLKVDEIINFIDSSPVLSEGYKDVIKDYKVDNWLDRLLGTKK